MHPPTHTLYTHNAESQLVITCLRFDSSHPLFTCFFSLLTPLEMTVTCVKNANYIKFFDVIVYNAFHKACPSSQYLVWYDPLWVSWYSKLWLTLYVIMVKIIGIKKHIGSSANTCIAHNSDVVCQTAISPWCYSQVRFL